MCNRHKMSKLVIILTTKIVIIAKHFYFQIIFQSFMFLSRYLFLPKSRQTQCICRYIWTSLCPQHCLEDLYVDLNYDYSDYVPGVENDSSPGFTFLHRVVKDIFSCLKLAQKILCSSEKVISNKTVQILSLKSNINSKTHSALQLWYLAFLIIYWTFTKMVQITSPGSELTLIS